MSFEQELSKGNFVVPTCKRCSKVNWPPTDYCSYCFGKIILKQGDFEGKIVESSAKDGKTFGIVEICGIRIMATILGTARVGTRVKIIQCGISDDEYFFNVAQIE